MSAIDLLFQSLHDPSLNKDGQKAFMPFITAGDPDLDFTAACLHELDKAGSQIIELGIPYSDPIADGPVIQASYTRALNGGTKLDAILEMLERETPTIDAAVVTMISYAIIHRYGADRFLEKATAAGVSGAIVPDMPVDEAVEFSKKCQAADFSLIHFITPTTSPERAKTIADNSSGFIYYVSVTGITGERNALPDDLVDNLRDLRTKTDLPICVGFGISQPDQASLLAPVADGVIVGSAIVRRIAQVSDGQPRGKMLAEIGQFAREMLAAIKV